MNENNDLMMNVPVANYDSQNHETIHAALPAGYHLDTEGKTPGNFSSREINPSQNYTSNTSMVMGNGINQRLSYYATKKEKRLQMLKKQKEEREMSEMQKKPKISQHSQKLVEKKRNLLRNAANAALKKVCSDQQVVQSLTFGLQEKENADYLTQPR